MSRDLQFSLSSQSLDLLFYLESELYRFGGPESISFGILQLLLDNDDVVIIVDGINDVLNPQVIADQSISFSLSLSLSLSLSTSLFNFSFSLSLSATAINRDTVLRVMSDDGVLCCVVLCCVVLCCVVLHHE
jgi:hypothetical protein